jgi:phosphate starvation-inducible membrane PsiE
MNTCDTEFHRPREYFFDAGMTALITVVLFV